MHVVSFITWEISDWGKTRDQSLINDHRSWTSSFFGLTMIIYADDSSV